MPPLRENADVEASTEEYARRFAGSVGRWFLEVQTRLTFAALAGLPVDASVLDVGGGHAQVAPALAEAGYRVTIVGSERSCGQRWAPWSSTGRGRFDVADLHHLPYRYCAFDAVVCYRLMAHSIDWHRLVNELCRVAAHRVVLDYPAHRSVNILSRLLFAMKRTVERGTTRRYAMYHRDEIVACFAREGFRVTNELPQFFLPMALHRLAKAAWLSRAAEGAARALGLTRMFGSPVIARADRADSSRGESDGPTPAL
jgi:SAM-dependent methyltransferase